MTEPVPVSGEDQPDPRADALARMISSEHRTWDWYDVGHQGDREFWLRTAVEDLAIVDTVDRAAGIRRVSREFTRQLQWAAWDDGYEAAVTGRQRHNPYRIEAGS